MTFKAPLSSPLLRREDLRANPVDQFNVWLKQAARGAVSLPLGAMLATVGANGQPLTRTVLLKFVDPDGFVFFMLVDSCKVRQMSENPQVSLRFPWLLLNRQISITGRGEKLGAGASWGGYRLVPDTTEFFHCRCPREPDRFLCARRQCGQWEIAALN